ncbi:TPA: 5'-nucleotidase [Yersinia enterocolitica]|uniref:5'-nucleotidase n=2 Tax=Yersinia enterocolitica TaxID=630 RepID=UPI0021E84FE8|nr:5'-nucleotidase [Yersinia enterocolitica]UYJ86125.1 5'-nucleotidase [Yersinia enterocolitica]
MMNNIEELREHCEEMIAISRMQYAYIPASSIITLIDRIEKAEKERDDLLNQEFQQRLANAKYQLHMKDLAIHNIKASRMAQFKKRLAAEAALSAANEKLKGEQVPVAVIVLSKNWPDTGRKVIDYYIEKIQHLPVGTELFTAPQKPVVLSSSTVMSRAYVVQAIKAAGFTVEGE